MVKKKRMVKDIYVSTNHKKAGMTLFITENVDFRENILARIKKFRLQKGSIHHKDITILNIHASTTRV